MARRSLLPAAVAVLAAPIRSPVLARANLVTRYRRYTLPSAVRRSSVSWPGSRRPLVLGLPPMKRIRAFDARVRMPARSECVLSAMSAALSESALTMRLNRFDRLMCPIMKTWASMHRAKMFSSRRNVLTRASSSANSCFTVRNEVSICQRSQ